MNKKYRDLLVLFAAITIIVGFIITMSHTCTGWFLIILGMAYLSGFSSLGQKWVSQNPQFLQWGLIGGFVVFFLLVIGVILRQ